DLGEGRGVNTIPDSHPTLPSNDGVFADQAVRPNPNARIWQVPEIIDMQNSSMHDQCVWANFDSITAGMKIDPLIQIRPLAQPDIARKPQPHAIFNRRVAVHLQNQAIDQ